MLRRACLSWSGAWLWILSQEVKQGSQRAAVLVSGIYSLSPVRCGASESHLPGPDVISFACGLAESCGPQAHAWRILLYQMLLNPENSDDELKS